MPKKLADQTEKLHMVVPVEWLTRIDLWRSKQPDLPNLSAAIRKLVDMGLEHAKQQRRQGR